MRQNKKLGQCFLTDKNFVKRAVESAELNKNDVVLEIGLGKGILTKEIAKNAKKVYVIELDRRLEPYADEILKEFSNVEVIWNDALKVDLKQLGFNKIVANLPYQISSPITFKFLENDFEVAVLMYQYEFAKRMVAAPGTKEYGRLSVAVQYKANVEFVCKVPPSAFSPRPKVTSAIIKLTKREKPLFYVENEEFFEKILRALFQHKNKIVKRALINSSHELGIDRKELEDILSSIDDKFNSNPFKKGVGSPKISSLASKTSRRNQRFRESVNLRFTSIFLRKALNERVFKLSPEKIGELSNLLYNNIAKKR